MNRNIVTAGDVERLAATVLTGQEAGVAALVAPAPSVGAPPTADDFWNRLMKYIPVEVIGAYLALTDAVSSVSDHTKREVVLWIIFGVVLVMTPVYLQNLTKVVRPRQRLASTGAFGIWAFALGGPFAFQWGGYESWMGGVAVVLYTFVLAVIRLDPVDSPQGLVAT